MPLYESTFIVRQDVSAQDTDKIVGSFGDIVKKAGGKVVKKEYWGLRTLAYKINKNQKGHYVMLGLDSPAEAIQEIERKARLNEDVLRNLTVRVDTLSEEPSAMMKAASSGESEAA